ncbi:hypothetical protein [Actinoallomurus iriomotensis]|uniref:Intracellular septation protein A n=1 Tax=Actinoallomurus iriomotensis TaxID=478107 RepID=A0A9W6SGH7_9ACTN|nr:hypothetical protein [Actinoallomurus iriomotensis]GLY91797.1 hypothetical protein Airi02_097250 [Actinoallomurus iriomotensis]
MTYVRTFLPWIVYAVVPSGSWQWGALAALVVAFILIAAQVRAGRGADAVIIEIGSTVFFAVLAAIAFADPHSGLHPYSAALANGTLAVIALVSLAVRRPFTLGIARQTTPREYWELPAFVRVNTIITSVWTASFVVAAVVLAVVHGNLAATVAVQIAALVVPIVFTQRYVSHVQSRAQRA